MMKGIVQRVVCLALVTIAMNINAARASKPHAAAVAAQAAQVAQAVQAANAAAISAQAVQGMLTAAEVPIAHEVASDMVHLVASSIVCASCAEGTAAQASLQDGLEASLAVAGQDAAEILFMDAADDALNAIESEMHSSVATNKFL